MSTVIRKLQALANPYLTVGLNLLFPPRCVACGAATSAAHGVCVPCFESLRFIASPQCDCCGVPFEYDPQMSDAQCGACLVSRPAYHKARAVFAYDDTSRRMITQFKYSDRVERANSYAAWMARAGAALIADSDVLVPVPLHLWRLLQRRYNQAALLAYSVSDLCHLPVWSDALLRVRHTPPQASLDRTARLENVKTAFAVNRDYGSALAGKRVLLVDDVMTTGATIEACTRTLLSAKVEQVNVVTLARTIRD